MSMDSRHEIDLRDAIPDTPDMCRAAVLHAASTYREERKMWKPSKIILAAALIAALLCGTAFAIVNYYSVRDYLANGNPSAAFEENVIPLEKSVTSHGLTVALGDAVFDGKRLAFTMDMSVAENAEMMYVYPRLQAFCGGEELKVGFMGTTMFSDMGGFVPHPDYPLEGVGPQAADAELDPTKVTGDVTWRFTLFLYKPTGEVVVARDWDDQNESYEAWEDYLRELAKEGKIGCLYGASIFDWLHAVSGSDLDATFTQRMQDTGLFELADTIVFEFTTAVPDKTVLISGASFPFDGYTVTVDYLAQSFMQLDYALTVRFDEPYQGHEHYLEQFYDLSDQNGVKLRRRTATLELAEDRMSCTVTGSVERISDEPLTAVTFTRKVYDWPEDMLIPAFTVDLTK